MLSCITGEVMGGLPPSGENTKGGCFYNCFGKTHKGYLTIPQNSNLTILVIAIIIKAKYNYKPQGGHYV